MSELSRPELMELYRVALDEYRFQVNLNWQRSQFYLTFNSALVAVGAGLLQALQGRASLVTALLFAIGVASCSFAILATRVQHAYYRATRAAKERIENALQLGELAIRTTVGMGGTFRRLGTVQRYNTLLLFGLIAANLTGMTLSIIRLVGTASTSPMPV